MSEKACFPQETRFFLENYKVDALCEQYMHFKTALDSRGVPSGILVQSSLGHGYQLNATMQGGT